LSSVILLDLSYEQSQLCNFTFVYCESTDRNTNSAIFIGEILPDISILNPQQLP